MGGNHIGLVVFDMEGTLTADPTVWEIMHLKMGTWESHGRRYWEEFKAGRLHYDDFARLDVATWKGAPASLLDEAVAEVPLVTGCCELIALLRSRGVETAIVSNGLERLGQRLAREVGLGRVAANREVVRDGRLTGELEILVPYEAKGRILERFAAEMGLPLDRVAAVGDGPADVAMLRRAGLGIAFCPSDPGVAEAAHYVVRETDLRRLIPLLVPGEG